MAKAQRFCIFCSGSPLTKEHMWADWLREYIPREKPRHGLHKKLMYPHKQLEKIEYRPGDTHSRTIKCVCGPCNSGWMSMLQSDAKPHLVPMLLGEKTALYRRSQTAIAAWVTMMVMVSDMLDESMSSIAYEERANFRKSIKTPSHWRIWIGRYEPVPDMSLWTHNVMALASQKVEGPALFSHHDSNSQTSTICLGKHVVIHVMSSPVARRIIRKWRLPPHIAPRMRQIWPIQDTVVTWPPDGLLSAADVKLMADQFFNRVTMLARRDALNSLIVS